MKCKGSSVKARGLCGLRDMVIFIECLFLDLFLPEMQLFFLYIAVES